MAAGPALLDVNTGLPLTGGSARYPTGELTTITSPGRIDTTQQTSVTESNQTQTQFSNILNTTPEALRALNQLIGQLSDRPAISDEELLAKAPPVQITYSRSGWIYTDPVTGRNISSQEAQQLNRERSAQREVLKRQAGVIPGGTAEQRETAENRKLEVSRTREQQGKYSKEAAFADAQFLIDKAIHDALEKNMPQIVAASEGAGTSKSTFRAQAAQEAATRGALEGGALGAQLGVQYGQIYNQLEAMLIELTKQDPNSPAAMLLQALQASKGMVQSGATQTNVSGRQTTQTQSQTQVGPTSQQQMTTRDFAGGSLPGAPSGLPYEQAQGLRITPLPGASPQNAIAPVLGYNQPAIPAGGSNTFDTNAAYENVVAEDVSDEY